MITINLDLKSAYDLCNSLRMARLLSQYAGYDEASLAKIDALQDLVDAAISDDFPQPLDL